MKCITDPWIPVMPTAARQDEPDDRPLRPQRYVARCMEQLRLTVEAADRRGVALTSLYKQRTGSGTPTDLPSSKDSVDNLRIALDKTVRAARGRDVELRRLYRRKTGESYRADGADEQ